MPYRDPDYVQKKIELIKKGLPIDISEAELVELESHMKGAQSFYVDLLQALIKRKETGEDVEDLINDESRNIAEIELAVRQIDEFRKNHWSKIKNVE